MNHLYINNITSNSQRKIFYSLQEAGDTCIRRRNKKRKTKGKTCKSHKSCLNLRANDYEDETYRRI